MDLNLNIYNKTIGGPPKKQFFPGVIEYETYEKGHQLLLKIKYKNLFGEDIFTINDNSKIISSIVVRKKNYITINIATKDIEEVSRFKKGDEVYGYCIHEDRNTIRMIHGIVLDISILEKNIQYFIKVLNITILKEDNKPQVHCEAFETLYLNEENVCHTYELCINKIHTNINKIIKKYSNKIKEWKDKKIIIKDNIPK